MTPEEMVQEFQCPGCVCGITPNECDKFKLEKSDYFRCKSHVLGTVIFGLGHIALGLPKGFCRPGSLPDATVDFNQMLIRLWTEGTHPPWDDFNVPVWALEEDGFLFVRSYLPRTNRTAVDVIDGGTLSLCPKAIDVSKFYDKMD